MQIAVVDIGTNSTRLLIADVLDGRLHELVRRTRVTRLGEGVDESGHLSDAAVERVLATCAEFREEIDRHSPERTVAVLTSAVRDADNGHRLERLLRERFGFEAETISGEREARLTYLGAVSARDYPSPLLVLDIGGGSTEFVVGHPGGDPEFHISTRMGSVRHTERHLHSDPPTADELAALAEDARAIVETDVPTDVRVGVEAGIAVAGTATSLAAIDQELDPYDPERVHGYRLTTASCERLLGRLAELTVEQRREVPGLHPDRAPTIVAGAGILLESMRACGLEEIEISENDILHGAALAASR
jgi:exopolyphosphatase / guanosine-5'-triphosphate,3'-diphosphate pyrophosphatase